MFVMFWLTLLSFWAHYQSCVDACPLLTYLLTYFCAVPFAEYIDHIRCGN